MSVESIGNAMVSTAPAVRPFRWGLFQMLMCLPGGFITGVTAYVFPGPFRIVNSITTVIYAVVFFGFMDKRRYGFVGYYALAALALFNYARLTSIILFRSHTRFRYLPPWVFFVVTLFIASFWIVPAVFYYPKRWNEFR